ncbi:hypothetical protein M569_00467, partial [Genlisea aurea]
MAGKRKRRNGQPTRDIHPRNKYCDNPPDFALLASLHPSLEPYVFYSRDGRPKIDWTDFNATRELTRVLLLQDHGLNWWIPDGHLCPTVVNRSNYIHWIEDLLATNVVENVDASKKGFDIGTGTNCIYPLLGASIFGWSFVGSDITDVAVEWASRNVNANPHISDLIEIRRVDTTSTHEEDGPPVLLGVVKEGETFEFCMCNPPFFDSMEEAGLNPKTCCGGTPDEMVCSGGELAFISRIIEDSTKLKHTFRWFTSMVGRKVNLNVLVSKCWNVGATVVKTTEFVQGRTSRWGLGWSFLPTTSLKKMAVHNGSLSFMLQGQYNAFNMLKSAESYFISHCGASCKLDSTAFRLDVCIHRPPSSSDDEEPEAINFQISVFEQMPGSLLVKGSLARRSFVAADLFSSVFHRLQE